MEATSYTAYNIAFEKEARDLVGRAFAALERGYPADADVDEKLRERANKIAKKLNDNALRTIIQLVAQWLSVRKAPSAAPKAREAAESVADITVKIAKAQDALSQLSEALRYSNSKTTEIGHDVQGLAQLVAGSLADAGRTLAYAREWTDELLDILPAGATGPRGVVGKLVQRPADEALAVALGRVWLDRGLTLAGGKHGGDGLNVILDEVIGNRKDAEKALTTARHALKCQTG